MGEVPRGLATVPDPLERGRHCPLAAHSAAPRPGAAY